MFGGGAQEPAAIRSATPAAQLAIAEWPEEEMLAFEKETLGFYVSGHPLNKYSDELRLFADASTETLYRFVDQQVNIGGIISQVKKTKIKKGRNEGKMMAKFILDDQFGDLKTSASFYRDSLEKQGFKSVKSTSGPTIERIQMVNASRKLMAVVVASKQNAKTMLLGVTVMPEGTLK